MPLFKKKEGKERKKFAETKVGAFLKEKGADILDVVDDYLPPVKILTALISKDTKLTPEDKAHAMELLKLDIQAEQEITERWKADMASDNWLSKSARPIILLYSWLLVTVVYVFGILDYKCPAEIVTMIEYLTITVNGAYFGSRTVEKVASMRSNRLKK